MNAATRREVSAALRQYRRDYARAITKQALRAYIEADIEARHAIGERDLTPKDWMVINKAALEFAKPYGRMLTDEGATVINGEKKPWLERMEVDERDKVTAIIAKGLEEGKATGYKESGAGNYPKNSIARQLQEHFDGRKSHASMVARTEIGRIQNKSHLQRWGERGYNWVQVLDDHVEDSCQACKDAHGQIWTREYAEANELEHPNCVRRFRPLRQKPEAGKEPIAPVPPEEGEA